MPLVIVGAERNITELNERLLADSVSAAERTRFAEAVAEANPRIDLADLRPGTVISIPRQPVERFDPGAVIVDTPGREGDAADETGIDASPANVIDAAFSYLDQVLGDVAENNRRRGEEARDERTELIQLLSSRQVAAAVRSDPGANELVKQTLAVLGNEEDDHSDREVQAEQVLGQWATGLARLRLKIPGQG